MIYLPEEHVEDAVAEYLKGLLPSGLHVFPAYGRLRPTYPCVVVAVTQNENAHDAQGYADERLMRVECQLLVEARRTRADGWRMTALRDESRGFRKALVESLASSDAVAGIASYGGMTVRYIFVEEITRNATQPIMESVVPVLIRVLPTSDLEV